MCGCLFSQECRWKRADGRICSTCSIVYKRVYGIGNHTPEEVEKRLKDDQEEYEKHMTAIAKFEALNQDEDVEPNAKRRRVRNIDDLGLTPFTKTAEVEKATGTDFAECCGIFWPEALYKAKKSERKARERCLELHDTSRPRHESVSFNVF